MLKKYMLFFCFAMLATAVFAQQDPQRVIIGTPGSALPKGKLTLRGRVLDAKSGEPILGAVLMVQPSGSNEVTENDGSFKLTIVPGDNPLEISFLGYENYNAILEVYGNGEQDFKLQEVAVELGTVTVTDKNASDRVNVTTPGLELLTMEKLERQAKFLGETDVLRSLQAVAGVTSAGEGASGINVRGGNTDENLTLMDGNLIFNPQHALGFFSLFHPDLMSAVSLYKGGAPARYGGRLSSVLDVRLREGNDEELKVNGGVSIATSRLAIEGPIAKKKASFIVGARAGYFDWILKRTKNIDLQKSEAFFYDVTAKADARLSPTTKLGFTGFIAADRFRFGNEAKFEYATYSASGYVKQILGEKMNLTAQANVGQYVSSLFDVEGNDQSQFTNRIGYRRGLLSGFWQATKALQLEAGAELNRYEVRPGELSPIGMSVEAERELPAERSDELSLYAQGLWSLGKRFEVSAGLRQTFYQSKGPARILLYQADQPKVEDRVVDSLQFAKGDKIASYTGLEPHLALRYNLTENTSIKLGYNRSFQFISQVSNTASALPISVWQLSNYYVEPQRADNFSIGYYATFKQRPTTMSVELFYRDIQVLIDYRDFAELLLNDHIETELLTGIGKAYGIELYIHKNFGTHRLEASYTFSRSLRQVKATKDQEGVNAGEWYPSNYDKPHAFNLNWLWKMAEKVSLSTNFTFSTGRPTTAPVSSFSNSNVWAIPVYSDRNAFRIPAYHRLDMGMDIGPWGKKQGREHSLTLSIYNFYARKNAFSIFFRQQPAKPIKAYRLAVLGTIFPAITYNFKF